MTGLTSSAVMNQRHSLNADALDFFPTPPWATRAVIGSVIRTHIANGGMGSVALDPCCGAGHMAIPLAEYFDTVIATDIADRGFGQRRDLDFLMSSPEDYGEIDWIFFNPPFLLAEQFLFKAKSLRPRRGIAMLARLNWLEGQERHQTIFGTGMRPAFVCPFAERVPMIEGVWDPEASSATAYAWFIWAPGNKRYLSQIEHIPPGSAARYTLPEDEALATRGEAARRAAARKAGAEGTMDLWGKP